MRIADGLFHGRFLVLSIRLSLALGLVATIPIVLPSCGGEEDKDEGISTAAAEKLLEEVNKGLKSAKAVDADRLFKSKFKKLENRIEDAEEQITLGETKKAIFSLRMALKGFQSLEKKTVELEELREKALAAQEEADKAQKTAIADKANTDAPREFKDARSVFVKASSDTKSNDARTLERAVKAFNNARNDFEEVIQTAKANRAVRQKAAGEKEAMLGLKATATGAGAEKHASQDWLLAGQQERGAEADLSSGNFYGAYEGFKMASQTYAAAVGQANIIKQSLKADQPRVPDPGGTPDEAPPADTVVDLELATDVDVVDVVDVVDDDEALAITDESTFLLANQHNLAGGIVSYDPETGEVALEYIDPMKLRADVVHPNKKLPYSKTFLKYRDPIVEATGGDANGEEGMPFVFHGNTRGLFLIPVPLTGEITIDYKVHLELMDKGAMMSLLLFSKSNGVTTMGVDFVRIWSRNSSGISKTAGRIGNKAWRGDPNYWFIKTKAHLMRVEIRQDEKKERYHNMSVFYRFGEDDGLNPASKARLRTGMSGYVGFQWNRAKFTVRSLKIAGILDKKRALKVLERKGIRFAPEEIDADEPAETGAATKKGSGAKTASTTGDDRKKKDEKFGF